jgi:hypothetical protein
MPGRDFFIAASNSNSYDKTHADDAPAAPLPGRRKWSSRAARGLASPCVSSAPAAAATGVAGLHAAGSGNDAAASKRRREWPGGSNRASKTAAATPRSPETPRLRSELLLLSSATCPTAAKELSGRAPRSPPLWLASLSSPLSSSSSTLPSAASSVECRECRPVRSRIERSGDAGPAAGAAAWRPLGERARCRANSGNRSPLPWRPRSPRSALSLALSLTVKPPPLPRPTASSLAPAASAPNNDNVARLAPAASLGAGLASVGSRRRRRASSAPLCATYSSLGVRLPAL